jgi:Fic family protein
MIDLSPKQQKILNIILEKSLIKSSIVREEMVKIGEKISLVTVKRVLSEMVSNGFLNTTGFGRATTYTITTLGRIIVDVDPKKYCAIDPDKRFGLHKHNFDLLPSLPTDIFFADELKKLNTATAEYRRRTSDLPEAIRKKELERLIIELAWKSSKIEGNTYTLLDTEKLILENKEAPGHDKKEALMIINHKDAFNFIYEKKE